MILASGCAAKCRGSAMRTPADYRVQSTLRSGRASKPTRTRLLQHRAFVPASSRHARAEQNAAGGPIEYQRIDRSGTFKAVTEQAAK